MLFLKEEKLTKHQFRALSVFFNVLSELTPAKPNSWH